MKALLVAETHVHLHFQEQREREKLLLLSLISEIVNLDIYLITVPCLSTFKTYFYLFSVVAMLIVEC